VWTRGRASTEECPKSLVTPASIALVESFWAWKVALGAEVKELAAREAEAFLTLEKEWREEQANGQ
jgi:hypothetical protein